MARNGARQGRGNGAGRRAEILDVAANVFARMGFVAATVRDIGDEAGILSGSLYHHFESKDAILEELLRPFLDELRATYDAIAQSDAPPGEQVQQLVRAVYQLVADKSVLVTILQNEFSYLRSQPRFAFVQEADRAVRASWLAVLEAGQADGTFRSDLDARLVYRGLMGAALSAVRWFHPREQSDVDILVDTQVRLLLGGLLTPEADVALVSPAGQATKPAGEPAARSAKRTTKSSAKSSKR